MKKGKIWMIALAAALCIGGLAGCGRREERNMVTEKGMNETEMNRGGTIGNKTTTDMTNDGPAENNIMGSTDRNVTENSQENDGIVNGVTDEENGIVGDVVEDIGDAGKDVIDGAENVVDDLTGNPNRETQMSETNTVNP